MTILSERKKFMDCIEEGITNGARKEQVCKLLGLSIRTLQRWEKNPKGDKRPLAEHKSPIALSEAEKDRIIEICTSHEYKDMNPNEIVPILAEKGEYYASESSFYRVLREKGLLHHRSECKPPTQRKAPVEKIATGPNQVWSWDITYLKTSIRGIFFYLYLFMDIWSRKIVGFKVDKYEDGGIASELITQICEEQGIDSIYLHSDNGAPMTCGIMLATLQRLGVVPSFSRARVSNDNPYSESLFKTMKYVPAYPQEFKSIEEATAWVNCFVEWYNNSHHHSGIKFTTPNQRHCGQDILILQKRKETYLAAKQLNPKRWKRNIKNWDHIEKVVLNKKTVKISMGEVA